MIADGGDFSYRREEYRREEAQEGEVQDGPTTSGSAQHPDDKAKQKIQGLRLVGDQASHN